MLSTRSTTGMQLGNVVGYVQAVARWGMGTKWAESIRQEAAIGLPDARVMCELCDGILVVVRADQTPRDDVEMALDLVDRRRILGAILNSEVSPERSPGERLR